MADSKLCIDKEEWIIETLKDFLGDVYEDITANPKEFRNWLDRMRWHVRTCDKLSREIEELKAQQKEKIKEQNIVKKEQVFDAVKGCYEALIEKLENMSFSD